MKRTAFSSFLDINQDNKNPDIVSFSGGADYFCNGDNCPIKDSCINNKMSKQEMFSKCYYLNGFINFLSKYIKNPDKDIEITDHNSLLKSWKMKTLSEEELMELYGTTTSPIIYVKTKCENCKQSGICKELNLENIKKNRGPNCLIIKHTFVYKQNGCER